MIQTYLLSVLVFLGIDAFWLGFVARNFYAKQIGHLMAETPNLLAAGVFYLLFLVGLQVFAINPALAKNSIAHAVQLGALFGFMTYATYDLTNYATLRGWPLQMVIVDLIWGTVLSAAVAGITVFVMMRFR